MSVKQKSYPACKFFSNSHTPSNPSPDRKIHVQLEIYLCLVSGIILVNKNFHLSAISIVDRGRLPTFNLLSICTIVIINIIFTFTILLLLIIIIIIIIIISVIIIIIISLLFFSLILYCYLTWVSWNYHFINLTFFISYVFLLSIYIIFLFIVNTDVEESIKQIDKNK